MGSSFNIGRVDVGSSNLRCDCGNDQRWHSVQLSGGKITAVCGVCQAVVVKNPDGAGEGAR